MEAQGDRTRVVFESSLTFDEEFPQFGTRHGVLPRVDPRIAQSSPLLWADAMDAMLARVAASDLDLQKLRAIAGSAQQHGRYPHVLFAILEDGLVAIPEGPGLGIELSEEVINRYRI